MKLLSIIVITYNSQDVILNCLGSVFAQKHSRIEVIVVDNASEDETSSIIKSKYPDVVLIENQKNLGPCKARNQGIVRANGKFILCLDDDTKLNSNFLVNIHKAIESDDSIGAVQPKVLMADGKTAYSTGIYATFLRRFYDIGVGKIDGERFSQRRDIFGASATAVLYRREALETIRQREEYFDEDFFYFFEDVDISWRMQKKGWRTVYAPDSVCFHVGGRSRNKDEISQYLCFRNRYLVIIKNESFVGFLRLFIVFFVYDLWRNLFMLISNPKYFFKASYEVVKFLPRMIGKRYNT